MFEAQLGRNPYPLWKGIVWARTLVKTGCGWRIGGNGRNVKIWEDNWILARENSLLSYG